MGAGAGIGLGVGIGAGAAGIGWFYSSVLLDTSFRPVYPERVLAADGGTVTLAATRLTRQPGTWGIRWADGSARGALAVMGPVVAAGRREVVRPLLAGPVPERGTAAVLDAGPYDPDPAARDLRFEDVDVPGPLGGYPAWYVPGDGDTWVVLVHGRGGTRREALRILPALHGRGHPLLVVSYRNDDGAPTSPDGRYHLGDTEWEDVEAAVRYAIARGAGRVVLFAWSMGGAITGAFLDRSADARAVAAVVWDAPLVDWRATLRQQARNRGLPQALSPLAGAVTSRRIGIDFDRFDLVRRPPAVRPPTLVVHGGGDTAVPVAATRALVAAAPGLDWRMRYLEVPDVEHTASWNADPAAYEGAVTTFLADVLDRPPAGAAPAVMEHGWHHGSVTEPGNSKHTATLRTNQGDIRITLFPDHAPKTVANFVGLATGEGAYSQPNAGGGTSGPFYDGSVFHRVIPGFMVQGGDPTGTGRGGPGYQFADEFHPDLRFDRPYLLAMANAGPGTNGSQFFITVGPTPHLNRRHTIFGEVADAESRAVVDAIAGTATDRSDRPLNDVVIEHVEIAD